MIAENKSPELAILFSEKSCGASNLRHLSGILTTILDKNSINEAKFIVLEEKSVIIK